MVMTTTDSIMLLLRDRKGITGGAFYIPGKGSQQDLLDVAKDHGIVLSGKRSGDFVIPHPE
jgi:hypothetical protein